MNRDQSPNPRLQRTPSASPPSPLSRQPLGRESNMPPWGRFVLSVLASLWVAGSAFASQGPILVVGMSLDPSLLEHAGLTVADLKAAAVSQLKSAGIEADLAERSEADGPRLAIAIPLRTSGGEIAAFVLLQYQTPARLEKQPATLAYSTIWSKWWGGSAKRAALAPEIRRGLKVLLEQFIAAYRKGEL